jgi:hypothetical protein
MIFTPLSFNAFAFIKLSIKTCLLLSFFQVATALTYGKDGIKRQCTAALEYAKTVADTIPEVHALLSHGISTYMKGDDNYARMAYALAASAIGVELAAHNAAFLFQKVENGIFQKNDNVNVDATIDVDAANTSGSGKASSSSSSSSSSSIPIPPAPASLSYLHLSASLGAVDSVRQIGDYFWYGWAFDKVVARGGSGSGGDGGGVGDPLSSLTSSSSSSSVSVSRGHTGAHRSLAALLYARAAAQRNTQVGVITLAIVCQSFHYRSFCCSFLRLFTLPGRGVIALTFDNLYQRTTQALLNVGQMWESGVFIESPADATDDDTANTGADTTAAAGFIDADAITATDATATATAAAGATANDDIDNGDNEDDLRALQFAIDCYEMCVEQTLYVVEGASASNHDDVTEAMPPLAGDADDDINADDNTQGGGGGGDVDVDVDGGAVEASKNVNYGNGVGFWPCAMALYTARARHTWRRAAVRFNADVTAVTKASSSSSSSINVSSLEYAHLAARGALTLFIDSIKLMGAAARHLDRYYRADRIIYDGEDEDDGGEDEEESKPVGKSKKPKRWLARKLEALWRRVRRFYGYDNKVDDTGSGEE